MIASIKGDVLVRRPDHVVIDCGGVGYRLEVSTQTLKTVPAIGKEAQLHAHLVGRDDGLSLYGFASEEERELFLMLISVAGIGPKVALAVQSQSPTGKLLRAIATGDAKLFQSVPGVGKKTSNRIIVELKDKVAGRLPEIDSSTSDIDDDPRIVARSGLMELGYTLEQAESMLDGVAGDNDTPEEMISVALRRSGPKARRESRQGR